jgi:ABC-type transport system involved in cytochrome c biogenesis ATPase subunit
VRGIRSYGPETVFGHVDLETERPQHNSVSTPHVGQEANDSIELRQPPCGVAYVGGIQQQVALDEWLLPGADLFIFDEPTHTIRQSETRCHARITCLAQGGGSDR